ncbi:MAG: patatin family protein [Eubacteriales bacterium]|nr:patatin family protein [Eubacteriales bacterium]
MGNCKTGLVLEGGAMRGMFTAGVLDVMMEENIRLDMTVGVSAGALFGVNYLSGQKGRVIRYNKRFNGDKDYMGLRPLLFEGNIVNTSYAYDIVPRRLDPFDNEAFMKAEGEFYAVVTEMTTGKPEYIKITNPFQQMDVLRASGSLPFVSHPVTLDGKKYLDGGIADSIPFEWLMQQGCSRVVVILTRDLTYRKKPMSQRVVKLGYRKYPALAEQMLRRHEVYNESVQKLIELEKTGEVFVIRPSEPIEIGRMEKNPEKLQEVYDLGVKDAGTQLQALREYLSDKQIN